MDEIQNDGFMPLNRYLKRQRRIVVLVVITIFCTHSWLAKADSHSTEDFNILDLLVPIIADSCIRRSSDPWAPNCLWERHAFYCPETTIDGITVPEYPSKPLASGGCDDGDMTLFNGLLCASGDERGCDGVSRAQSSDGRFWRSPRRAAAREDDFSPDMSLGVMLYVASTGDIQAFERFLDWIEDDRRGRSWPNLPRFCDNDACTMRPIDVALITEAALAFGITPPEGIKNYYDLVRIVNTCDKIDFDLNWTSEPGYPYHLQGVRILLMRMLNIGDEQRLNDLARQLAEREPDNPFFAYLKEGATIPVRELTTSLCPVTTGDVQQSDRHQWAWERTDSEMAWKNSMLWDCIFMVNLFTKVQPVEQKAPHLADNFICYPNPVSKSRGTIRCRLRVEQGSLNTAAAQIDFLNVAGERVVEYHDVVEVGKDVFREVSIENLAVGCYFARLSFAASCLSGSREYNFCVN